MALTVNTNVASLSAQRSLGGSQNMLTMEKNGSGTNIVEFASFVFPGPFFMSVYFLL